MTPGLHAVVELRHWRARAKVSDAAERAAARRVATPARLAAVPVAGGPYDLRHHHHLAVNRHRHDLGLPVHRLRLHDDEAARTYIFRGEEHGLGGRLALGLPVRRLRVCPGLLGHDDGLRLGLGLPVHRLRLHGDRLHGDRLHGDRLHGDMVDDDGLGGRLNDCSLDDCSLDDMAWLLSLSSTKFWREARRLLGLHRVGAVPGRTSSLRDLTASRESILQRPKSSPDRLPVGQRSLSPRTFVARPARRRGRVLTQASLRGYIVSSARPLGEKRAGARHRRRAGSFRRRRPP